MSELAPLLRSWHRQHGRHDLPWQHPRSPYRVWLSEVMLQQTQVATVIGYFARFVAALPDLPSLARADEERVLALWSGLGYYRRARHLHQAARICLRQHDGRLPVDFDALLALPGIGRSTAGAILALAHGRPYPILDGNAKRVLARYFAVRGQPGVAQVDRELWRLAQANTPDAGVTTYTQAMMDLGATVCTRADPQCGVCPLTAHCAARQQGLVAELPTRRKAKPLPEREVCMLVLRSLDGRILLHKRGTQGVWPGLWSLPEATDETDAARQAKRFVSAVGAASELPAVPHTFSHFRLMIRPLLWPGVEIAARVGDNADLRWVAARELATMGLPAPVRRLLQPLLEPA